LIDWLTLLTRMSVGCHQQAAMSSIVQHQVGAGSLVLDWLNCDKS